VGTAGLILFIIVGGVALALIFALGRKRARMRRVLRPSPVDAETARIRLQQRAAARRHSSWPRQLQQLEHLAFPYELVPGAEAEAAYEAARITGETEGFTPLIITPDSLLLPPFSRERLLSEAQRILAAAPQAEKFFAERRARLFRHGDGDSTQRMLDEAEAFALAEPVAAPANADNRMSTLQDMAGQKPPFPWVEEAALVRIPTPRSWEIPAYTMYGGWNGCPDSAVMVAVARYWNETHGADICALGKQTLEFRVARPPADQPAALALIREQMLFCAEGLHDLISAPPMFRDVVAQLRGQRYWLFWWDY
jgi:Domain of unknown function (DUF4253)